MLVIDCRCFHKDGTPLKVSCDVKHCPSTSKTQLSGHVLLSGALLSYSRIVMHYRHNATDHVPVPMLLARWIRRFPLALDSSTADQHSSGPIIRF